MDESYRTITLARVEQWIGASLIATPAYFALNFTAVLLLDDAAVNLNGLFRIELILTVHVLL